MVLKTKQNIRWAAHLGSKEICAHIRLEPAKAEDGAVDDHQLKKECDAALRILSEAGRYGDMGQRN